MNKTPPHILPLIILSQFAGTSLWFAVNAILPEILHGQNNLGNIISVVQFGFIAGTLLFAIFSVADRFAPSKVFFVSSLVAAAANAAIIWLPKDIPTLYFLRFITGFFLAGIYPVGMKIAADWYEKGLGKALGYLVGALVLGTAFPNLLKSDFFSLPWKDVLIFTSAFAVAGGLLMLLFVGDGPFRKTALRFQPSAVVKVFRSHDFRGAAFGYFGHMWELYTFWAFVPAILLSYNTEHNLSFNIYPWAFIVIAIGSLSCVAGGYISQKTGSARVAFVALVCSGICCLLSMTFHLVPVYLFYALMIFWGVMVIADSPQFSTLVAQTAIPEYKGTALTIVTCLGFSITIGSIQLINHLLHSWKNTHGVFLLLAPGPLIGLLFVFPLIKRKK